MSWLSSRRRLVIELVVCTLLVLAFSVYALWRMDYLSPGTAEHVRMTDSTRTAYVAKNIAEGRGYTTNELPAFLVDFYEQRGKLHADTWPNADRFPFTAYAVAGLYLITGSTSYEVGILGYNLICFVAMLVMLYWLTRSVWNDRWPALATLALALLHPLTYVYLYLKDADMILLTMGVMTAFLGYFRKPADELSWKRAIAMGTTLAWLYLARPNIGIAFIAYFGFLIVRRVWHLRRELGVGNAIASVARREGIAVGVIVLWCLPFVIHSMSEWNAPMFSANSLYQLPLGTRYTMDTDTWWKYSEPGVSITLGTLIHGAPGELIAKFTTSWVSTLKVIMHSYALELLLGFAGLAWLSARHSAGKSQGSDLEREQAFRKVARMVGFAVLLNFLVLPLYGYQNYGYRHYLSFYLPLIWIASGQAIVVLVNLLRPVLAEAWARIRSHPSIVLAIAVLGFFGWNCTFKSQDANQLFASTADVISKHWLSVSIGIACLLFYRQLSRLRWRSYTVVLIATSAFVVFRYQPMLETKRLNLNWFPLDDKVWDVLRERKGLVMSFAMQSEVNWASDRRNIPAPEFAMHVYSLLFDHKLEVEDVYIESAEALTGPWDGAFFYAAPGFESYARLQKFHGKIPGYEIVFHKAGMKGYPPYRVKPRPKASTVYRLVDRDAVLAMAHSPTQIELGNVDNVIYTAHGWGDYVTVDGKPAVAATATTRQRYLDDLPERPYEDTSVTFFLDENRPSSVDLDIYAIEPTSLQFYWNLDLYAYDLPRDRAKHEVGTYEIKNLGWQRVHLEIPPGVTRKGFNKLGFRTASFKQLILCPAGVSDDGCASQRLVKAPSGVTVDLYPTVLHDEHTTTATATFGSLLAGTLEFHYDNAPKALPSPP